MKINFWRKKAADVPKANNVMFGQGMTFAAKEAYKLLRTNLLFSLPETTEGRGYIVGVTSSVKGEGKSTTTMNLASTLAEQGEEVLIIEADLRLPSLHKHMRIAPSPGLSNVLVSRCAPERYIQTVNVGRLDNVSVSFDVLSAGNIPPNPSELLGSNRMKQRLNYLAKNYSFILLDLPPVTAVTDALVVTKLVDGIVMVVRNEYADTRSLKEAMRQLEQVDAKVLGFVYTCAGSGNGTYKKRYQHSYYKDYEAKR